MKEIKQSVNTKPENNNVWIGRDYGYKVEFRVKPIEKPEKERIFDPMRGYGVGK